MNIASLVIRAYLLKAKSFERATKDPLRSQEKMLKNFLARNKDTAYGKKYGFRDIRSVADYQRNVPLNDYETLRPYIDCLMRGEDNILTIDRTILFAVTSGTMGKPKYIPVTEYSRKKKREVEDYLPMRNNEHFFNHWE